MRTTRTTHHRLVSLFLASILVAAACGGSDDSTDNSVAGSDDSVDTTEDTGAPDNTSEEYTPDEGSEPSEDGGSVTTDPDMETGVAPAWAYDPAEVRELTLTSTNTPGFLVRDGEEGISEVIVQGPCAYRESRLAVYGISTDEATGLSLTSPEQPEAMIEIGEVIEVADFNTAIIEVKGIDPIVAAVRLAEQGILASPVYLASPMPARMFFPGTLPVPVSAASEAVTAVEAASSEKMTIEGSRIVIVDTGAGTSAQSGDEETTVGVIGSPWTYGHGAFIDNVVASSIDVDTHHVKIESTDSLSDEIQLSDAVRRTLHPEVGIVDGAEGPTIINMSFGVYPCYVEGRPIVPVLTMAAFAHSLVGGSSDDIPEMPRNAFIVAAAGNSNDGRLTVPAAFADTSIWLNDFLTPAGSTPIEAAYLSQALPKVQERLIAVSATNAIVPPEPVQTDQPGLAQVTRSTVPYGSAADWVTTVAEGCHVAPYRGGDISYPEHAATSAPAVTVPVGEGELVYWCGTSFATPVITAEVARALNGSDGTDAAEAFTALKCGYLGSKCQPA